MRIGVKPDETGDMVSDTVVEWVSEPLVPVMVSGNVPVVADEAAWIVSWPGPGDIWSAAHVTPATPLHVTDTVLLNPLTAPTVTADVALLPAVTLAVPAPVIVKSAPALTVRVTGAECVSAPLVPVIVSVYVPAAADEFARIVRALAPGPIERASQVTFATPLHVTDTVLLNPLSAAIVTL
jgi:hypothetical protein